MSTISDFLLTQIINYGAPLFALNLFLGAIGLPIGASFMVIAAGAFVQQGYFSWIEMFLLGLAGVLIGDALSFGMGYYGKDWVQGRFGSSSTWKSARQWFQKRAGISIFLTRFLITALAIPTNLIAGGSGFEFSRFMLYDLLGEVVWILLYGGLGYVFGSEWELVNDFISNFGGLLLGLIFIVVGIRQARNWQSNKGARSG